MVYSDPSTGKHIGIICDLCSTIFKDKFEYFNAKFDLVRVDNELKKTGPVDIDRRCLDLDVCTECMDRMKKQVIQHEEQRRNKPKWTSSSR